MITGSNTHTGTRTCTHINNAEYYSLKRQVPRMRCSAMERATIEYVNGRQLSLCSSTGRRMELYHMLTHCRQQRNAALLIALPSLPNIIIHY